jgi:hypothetical protein
MLHPHLNEQSNALPDRLTVLISAIERVLIRGIRSQRPLIEALDIIAAPKTTRVALVSPCLGCRRSSDQKDWRKKGKRTTHIIAPQNT